MRERKRLIKRLISLLLICSLVVIPPSTALGEDRDPNVQVTEQVAANDEMNQESVNEEDQSVISSVTGSSVSVVSSGAIQSEESLSIDENTQTGAENEIILAATSDNDFEIDSNGVLIKYSGEGGEVIIPDGVTEIGDRAFSDCINITNICIPQSVTRVDDFAFSGCTGLTIIDIPSSITYIGNYAFLGCSNLITIIYSEMTWFGNGCFNECNKITNKFFIDSNKVLCNYYGLGGDVVIPKGVKKLALLLLCIMII